MAFEPDTPADDAANHRGERDQDRRDEQELDEERNEGREDRTNRPARVAGPHQDDVDGYERGHDSSIETHASAPAEEFLKKP